MATGGSPGSRDVKRITDGLSAWLMAHKQCNFTKLATPGQASLMKRENIRILEASLPEPFLSKPSQSGRGTDPFPCETAWMGRHALQTITSPADPLLARAARS
ncbi:hypothetical protein BaRGS_00003760 [Batillaria attramentaria]|uniref:Uncharacterized protein n=1 Tax=Batillaria attramentaria TaxID=370345 RepID=A0ABD0M0H4_9CAEN